MKNEIRDIIPKTLMFLFSFFPIDQQKVVFKSFRGLNSGDNPGAIFEEMRKKEPNNHYYWVLQDTNQVIEGAKIIKHGSISEIYHLATSKLWIDNKRKGCWSRKRKGQLYLQTWHGGVAGKLVEKDACHTLDSYYIKSAQHDSYLADYMTSGSKWQSLQCRRAFWFENEILEFGLPRSDVFYKKADSIISHVREFFSIGDDFRICLYAPTFRENKSLEPYNLDFKRLCNTLKKRFSGNWKILVRLHPNIQFQQNELIYSDECINGSLYPDINDLIVASDVLITDYSSCMFDALEANKFVFIFATDYSEYMKERGSYFKPEEMPFPMAYNNDELMNNILAFNQTNYKSHRRAFINDVIGNYNDGTASEKIVEFLFTRMRSV